MRVASIWLLLISTRPLGYWVLGVSANADGTRTSPADQSALVALMLAAILILYRRRIKWGQLVSNNYFIFALYLFFFSSMLWADFPFVVFKRIVKDFSLVLLALTFVTENDSAYAIRRVFRRCSYIVFPLSAVLIKYFPSIGTFDSAGGQRMATGLTDHKNTLGAVVLTYSLILIWDLVEFRKANDAGWLHKGVVARCLVLGIGAWLMIACDSMTSLLSLIMGIFLYWGAGRLLRMNHPKRKLLALSCGCLLLFTLSSVLQLQELVVEITGRDMTLTGRTEIWEEVLGQPVNRVVGAGFLMFWDTPYGRAAVRSIGENIKSAHSGYVEFLLDGGLVGVFLLGMMLLASGNAIMNRMVSGDQWSRLGFTFWVILLIHNLTEASFFRFSILWFVLLLSIIAAPSSLLGADRVAVANGSNLKVRFDARTFRNGMPVR